MLNPEQKPFCVGASSPSATLPIRINQSNPILIELLRIDIDTNINETITLTAKEVKKLQKTASKQYSKNGHTSPCDLQYPVKASGLYRLQRVVDESKLEVQRQRSDTLVVQCPIAATVPAPQHKCKGDLSDFYLQVEATPPLQVKYSKVVNGDDQGHTMLSIHPDNFVSPLARQKRSEALVSFDSSANMDVSWAKSQKIKVPLNESLGAGGRWQYVIDEVHDACGNVVNHSEMRMLERDHPKVLKGLRLEQAFSVHERPRVAFRDYDSQHPIRVARGKSKNIPINLSTLGSSNSEELAYTISYLFTPQDELLPDQTHSNTAIVKEVAVKDAVYGINVRNPGLYTLQTVRTGFCDGEVLEPSSCLLENPPEPDLTLDSEKIPDRCAGNFIGLLVNLDFLGTPPFQVSYTIRRVGDNVTPRVEKIDRLHSQLELRPSYAGHYVYQFTSISDAVYGDPISLLQKNLILEVDVKPPAAARIFDAEILRKVCIEEPVTFTVQMLGESPYSLDYELIHRGHRKKRTTNSIEDSVHTITTDPLRDGGEYTLALTSITDQSGCKVFLKAEAKIDVGLQRPRAAFGHLEGKRSILALEAKKIALPLRMQGDAPWSIRYRNLDNGQNHSVSLRNSNDHIDVAVEGTYELLDVRDTMCPGSIDGTANRFAVQWIPRPSVHIVESPLIHQDHYRYVKKEVCEQDQDSTDISFQGTAPFELEYEQYHKPDRGSNSMSLKKLSAGLSSYSLRMETSEAGLYDYKLSKLGDSIYNHDHRKFSPLTVQQRVNPSPSASFSQPGKVYKYCNEEDAGGESIPISLTGLPPFQLELEIKHHAVAKPELINIPNVESNQYNLQIPHRLLSLGTHAVTIRKVRDTHGCQRTININPPRVQVSVAEIPNISPLEEQTHYCVGDRISYALSGSPPFNVYYTFQGHERKAIVPTTNFRRIAEKPGSFVITAISDQRSTDACKAKTTIGKEIHEMPSVRVSKGKIATVDIHEGGEAEILFDFGGTPPFYFT